MPLVCIEESEVVGAHGGCRTGGKLHPCGTGKQYHTQWRGEKARVGGKRGRAHQRQGGRGSVRMRGKGRAWEDEGGRLEKEGRPSGKIAAFRNIALFMHCTVGLPGEELLLDRLRTPGTNCEALNYLPQHRETMRQCNCGERQGGREKGTSKRSSRNIVFFCSSGGRPHLTFPCFLWIIFKRGTLGCVLRLRKRSSSLWHLSQQ